MRKKLGLPTGWIITHSGEQFSPLEPDPAKIKIEDIAHALGNTCRFTGHCRRFYSVAQHSLICAEIARNIYEDGETDKAFVKRALLHDASEAYLCDIARPVKHTWQFASYRQAEKKLQRVIEGYFDLPANVSHHKTIKEIDEKIVTNEALALMPVIPDGWQLRPGFTMQELEDALPNYLHPPFQYMDPETAATAFMQFYRRYC
jgi:hypothetical protein